MQLRRTYIMFERDEGVVLIDQHSAHERVLFEQFMYHLECGNAPSQRLLFPLTLHLGPAEGDAFDGCRPTLEKLGYEVESFGGHTLLVRAGAHAAPPVRRGALPARDALGARRRPRRGNRRAARAARRHRWPARPR
jgi:DNA mismatch repair protein MutL